MAQEVRFAAVRKLLESHGWRFTRVTGSHHIFTKPGETAISIPVHGNKVKPRYVRLVEKKLREDRS